MNTRQLSFIGAAAAAAAAADDDDDDDDMERMCVSRLLAVYVCIYIYIHTHTVHIFLLVKLNPDLCLAKLPFLKVESC